MTELVCQGCGGPLTITRSGQTLILPTTRMTLDGEHVIAEETTDDMWCGDCVDAWDQAITDREESR